MSISFRCSNPACGKSVTAPDGTEGRKARCPACGAVQTIPLPAPPAAPRAEHPAPTPVPVGSVCGECGAVLPSRAMLCPQCGWVNPASYGSNVPPPIPTTQETGSMTAECCKALKYALSNLGSLIKLVLYSIGLAMGLGMIRGFFNWLVFFGPFGIGVVVLVALLCELVVGGYFLRFYLDCAIGSLEGVNQAPDVPDFDFKELLATGYRGLGIAVVYILPVITIPLLPLGLLAWAYSDDLRMFDLRWALRAAAKKPGQLGVLWLMLLLWGVVGGAALVGTWFLSITIIAAILGRISSGIEVFFVGLFLMGVAGFFLGVVFHTFMAMQFRCVGMLGRYNRDLLDLLPETTEMTVPVGVLVGGVVLSGMIWWGAIRQIDLPSSPVEDSESFPMGEDSPQTEYSLPEAEP